MERETPLLQAWVTKRLYASYFEPTCEQKRFNASRWRHHNIFDVWDRRRVSTAAELDFLQY
jgi:hypothetical protein